MRKEKCKIPLGFKDLLGWRSGSVVEYLSIIEHYRMKALGLIPAPQKGEKKESFVYFL